MTDPVKEQLSACLDGELPEAELALLLKQSQREPRVLESMSRYALIGEAMRTPRPVAASKGFADRIAAAIDAEPAPAVVMAPRWMRPAAGLAVAAGVAAIAVIAFQPATLETPQIVAAADPVAEVDTAPSYTVPTNVDATASYVPAARLTNYVVAHSEYSSPLGRRTVLSGVLSDDDRDPDEEPVVNVSNSSAEPQR